MGTQPAQIDPRGARFAAAITSLVLAVALVLGPRWGVVPLAWQTLVFAVGAVMGPSMQPYGRLFAAFLRPRLGPPESTEDARPPRFAQAVGLVFAVVGLLGALIGAAPLFYVAVGFALAAALLNAVFDICLGCEVYVRWSRLRTQPRG